MGWLWKRYLVSFNWLTWRDPPLNSFKLGGKRVSQKRPERYHGERVLLMEPRSRKWTRLPESNSHQSAGATPWRPPWVSLALPWWILMNRAERLVESNFLKGAWYGARGPVDQMELQLASKWVPGCWACNLAPGRMPGAAWQQSVWTMRLGPGGFNSGWTVERLRGTCQGVTGINACPVPCRLDRIQHSAVGSNADSKYYCYFFTVYLYNENDVLYTALCHCYFTFILSIHCSKMKTERSRVKIWLSIYLHLFCFPATVLKSIQYFFIQIQANLKTHSNVYLFFCLKDSIQ